ncbi:sigma-70 family RNA polymerase sigma factor [Bacillus marasmi]|uniref:sigma-70 family RNA polymerase sigma factor n=1 Tax=Bacillus marasmi TaxID=1926279 RepID=UPI00164E01DE|nr:sigma-70 family RNA polymerase sigma factor [Bacillus marasmi]
MHNKLSKVSKDIQDFQDNLTDEKLQEFYPKLRRYCQFISQNCWDRDELVQESLLKVLQHYMHLPEIPTALLNRIARNEWIDTARKRNKESIEAIPEQAYDESKRIEDRYEVIQKLMNNLTPKQTVMFALKEGFLFQISEIAMLFNTTETAVKATIYRAKQRLEKQWTIETNPIINRYWDFEDQQQIEKILYHSFKNQDPTILIKSIPKIPSLRKGTDFTCSMHKSSHIHFPSSTVRFAA